MALMWDLIWLSRGLVIGNSTSLWFDFYFRSTSFEGIINIKLTPTLLKTPHKSMRERAFLQSHHTLTNSTPYKTNFARSKQNTIGCSEVLCCVWTATLEDFQKIFVLIINNKYQETNK